MDSLAKHQPRLRPEVLISEPLLLGPKTVHLVKDTDSGQSFEVGARERFLMVRMDGDRTLAEIGAEYAETFGKRLGDAQWGQLLGLLGSRGLLAGAPQPPARDEGAEPKRRNGPLGGSIRLVADAHATAGRLHRHTGFLLGRAWGGALLATLAVMLVALAVNLGALIDGTATVFTNPVLLMGVATLLWFSTALHELAHGVAARHYGGQVGEIGLRWRLPVVIMYCTVDNYPYMSTRWHRIVVAGAGAVMNLLFLLPFFVWWALAPDGDTREGLAGLLFLGALQAAAMLVPLPPLDGYTIVGQLLGTARLAESTRVYWSSALRRAPGSAAYPRRARNAYRAYGVGAVLVVALLVTVLILLVQALLNAS
ncbi:M50 family metallopeptidase [Streptomyces sp. NBRC 109706]|uniref:M50 family metallopeptidase n=1 Tax=Streptomyces sp. NBRC 109706 TaxID=1550035 RepID=UPI00078575AE|nr:M50 family metallopeptidase [Streptomyces sp. NBRC 109706]